MAVEGSGWPLGLETVNLRVKILEAIRDAETNPFHLPTPSFSSLSSSDLDTESAMSFFPDKSITLGNLMGIRSNHHAIRYPSNIVHSEVDQTEMTWTGTVAWRPKNYGKVRKWKSLMRCMQKDSCTDKNAPSLGHFLEAERRAGASVRDAYGQERVYINIMYEESDGVESETNPPLLDGHVNIMSQGNSRMFDGTEMPVIEENFVIGHSAYI